MTADRRTLVAATLWAVLAFILWNVVFDRGVERAATTYLAERNAYLRGHGPRVQLAPAMHAGVSDAARRASFASAPCVAVSLGLVVASLRGVARPPR